MRKVLKTIFSIALSLLLVFTVSVNVNTAKASDVEEVNNTDIDTESLEVQTNESEGEVQIDEDLKNEEIQTFENSEEQNEGFNNEMQTIDSVEELEEKSDEETDLEKNLELDDELIEKRQINGAASVDETIQHSITYKVNFNDKGLGSVPGSISDFFNRSTAKVNHGDSYSPVSPEQTEVLVVGGMWRFKGYDVNYIDSVTEDTVITANWEQVWNNLTLNYVFISANTDALPHDVLELLPSAENVEFGKSYTVKQPAKNRVEVSDGRWDFVGYDYDIIESVKESIDIRGVWRFTRIEKPEPIEVDPVVDTIPDQEKPDQEKPEQEEPVQKEDSSYNGDDKNTVDKNEKTVAKDTEKQVKDKDLTKETAKKLSKKSKSVKDSKVVEKTKLDSNNTSVKLVASGKSPQTSDSTSVPYMHIVLSISVFALLGTILLEKKRS